MAHLSTHHTHQLSVSHILPSNSKVDKGKPIVGPSSPSSTEEICWTIRLMPLLKKGIFNV